MFEKYIEQKEQSIADYFNLEMDYVNFYEVMFHPKLEPAYKTYFSAEVDWWIYEEQTARSSNIRFNFEDPRLASFLTKLDEIYKKNARFSTEALPQIISSAVKTRLNMLIRPRTAVKWFVFRWEQTKTYQEIIKRLNYIFDNKYLTDGFTDYVQRKNLIKSPDDIITISQFDKIITEVDNEMFNSLTPEDFIALLNPLFSFFNFDADHKDTAKIPVEAVIIFFDDKNLYTLSTKLEQKFRSGELLLISKKYLLGFIYKSLYDADNLYGSDQDNITTVTKEIEQSHNNYINLADGLKESIRASAEDYRKEEFDFPNNAEEFTVEDIEAQQEEISLYDEQLEEPLEESDFELDSSNFKADFNLSGFGFSSEEEKSKIIETDIDEIEDLAQEPDAIQDMKEEEAIPEVSKPIVEAVNISDSLEELEPEEKESLNELNTLASEKKQRFNDILSALMNELND